MPFQRSCINWDHYSNHMKSSLHDMMLADNLTDVTLVCDDKTRIKAHKVILSACSTIFRSIIEDLPETKSVIFLRGIQKDEMTNILEFMYKGEAIFEQDRMESFLSVAKDLEIVEISGIDKEESIPSVPTKDQAAAQIQTKKKEKKTKLDSGFDCNQCSYFTRKKLDLRNHIEQMHSTNSYENLDKKRCDQSKKEIASKNDTQAKHEIGNFGCNKCDHKAISKANLRNHIRTVHLGLNCVCNLCGKIFSEDTKLNIHMQTDHNLDESKGL